MAYGDATGRAALAVEYCHLAKRAALAQPSQFDVFAVGIDLANRSRTRVDDSHTGTRIAVAADACVRFAFTGLEVVGSAEQFVGREAVEHAAGGG